MTQGHHSSKGMNLLPAMLHMCPGIGKQSRKGLHRGWRGLDGWVKKCASRSRVPQPFEVFTAIANHIVIHGRKDKALFILISWSTCARPNLLSPLQTQFLLKPGTASDHWCVLSKPMEKGAASKTNECDISVALDHEWRVNLFGCSER